MKGVRPVVGLQIPRPCRCPFISQQAAQSSRTRAHPWPRCLPPSSQPLKLQPMYSSTFIFAKGQYDDEFHRLDEVIANAARATPGYLGEETWENPSNGLISNVYYWESLEALQGLVKHPTHLEAKSKQGNWLAGYQVVISQVLRTYGDSKLKALLPMGNAA